MIVLDASAAVEILQRSPRGRSLEKHVFADRASVHAPDLLHVEVLGALRRVERRGELSAHRAEQALLDLHDLPISLYPSGPLLTRAWELRANLTAADALYTALAESLDAALLTTDRRMATGVATQTSVTLVEP